VAIELQVLVPLTLIMKSDSAVLYTSAHPPKVIIPTSQNKNNFARLFIIQVNVFFFSIDITIIVLHEKTYHLTAPYLTKNGEVVSKRRI
jgi:hypothetical protein